MMKTVAGPFQRPHSRGWEEGNEDHLPCLLQIITRLAVSKLRQGVSMTDMGREVRLYQLRVVSEKALFIVFF